MKYFEEEPWQVPGSPATANVRCEGAGIYYLRLTINAEPACFLDIIPAALANWREKHPELRIVSVATLVPENKKFGADMHDQSLLIVTESK